MMKRRQRIILVLFLGCFTTDPLLFVWEQYLITSDIPNFHDEFLPAIATGIIVTLRDLLMECKKVLPLIFINE
jgi:hypothetical protein